MSTILCITLVVVGPEKKFKTRDDFSSSDDYAIYVRDNISVGIMVRCCEAYEEVRLGDVGKVMKVSVLSVYYCILGSILSIELVFSMVTTCLVLTGGQ